MNEYVINIISAVVTAVVLPLITLAGKALIDFLNTKIKNEKLRTILTEATNAVQISVEMVAQTYVDSLKSQGKFDAEAQKTAFGAAIDNAKKLITDEAQQKIAEVYKDFDTWLATNLESFVAQNKLA